MRIGISSIKLDVTKLEALEREMQKHYVVRVGILGAGSRNRKATVKKYSKSGKLVGHKKGEEAATLTNAELGLVHEKGSKSDRIPRRSFIELPLQLKLPGIIAKLGQKIIDGLTKEKVRPAYVALGEMGENIIQGAFSTQGYGRWPSNAAATIAAKKSSKPLIDTAQLRRSITSQVVSRNI